VTYALVKALLCVLLNTVAVERMIMHSASPHALSFLKTAIIFLVYECKQCFNWLVAQSGQVKTSQVMSISMDF